MSGRMLTVLTSSELGAFQACAQRWGLRYVDGLAPKAVPRPLRVGSVIHIGLAALIGTMNPSRRAGLPDADAIEVAREAGKAALLKANREALADVLERAKGLDVLESSDVLDSVAEEAEHTGKLGVFVIDQYLSQFAGDWRWLIPLEIEGAFRVNLRDRSGRLVSHLVNEGVWDMVAFDKRTGDVPIFDHKTTAGAVDALDKKVELDPQMAGYVASWVEKVRQFGGVVRTTLPADLLTASEVSRIMDGEGAGRVIYNVIRKRFPEAPELTKKGLVSAARITTTPALYESALRDQESRGLPITDKQADLLADLRRTGDRFISRREFWRSAEELERWRSDAFRWASLMREAERDPSKRLRNPTACTAPWSPACSYRGPCLEPENPLAREGFRVAPRHEEVEDAISGSAEGEGET